MAKVVPTVEQVSAGATGPAAGAASSGAPPPPMPSNMHGGTAGIRPATAVPLKQRRGWRPGLMLLGLFLVVGAMLGGILLLDSVSTTKPVLVAAGDLERGQVLEISDVRVAEVSLAPDVEVLTLDEQSFLGGEATGEPIRALKGFVPAGTLLSEDHFTVRSNLLEEGESLVGLRLESGEYPSLLKIGDVVEMYEVTQQRGDSDAVLIGRAEVWRVWQAISVEDRTEDLVADLVVDTEVQSRVIQAHAYDTLRLTVIQTDEG